MLRSEVFRLRRRRVPRLLISALVASVILTYGIVWFILRRQPFGLAVGGPVIFGPISSSRAPARSVLVWCKHSLPCW